MGDSVRRPVPMVPCPRDPIGERVARLVAEAPAFTAADIAELSLIMGPAVAPPPGEIIPVAEPAAA